MKSRFPIACAAVLSLFLAPPAPASYLLPFVGANGELFANFTVVEPGDDYDTEDIEGDIRDLSEQDENGLWAGLTWYSDLLGSPALVPSITIYPLQIEDDNAAAMSETMEDGRGTLLFQNFVLGETSDDPELLFDFDGVAKIELNLTAPFVYEGDTYNFGWDYQRVNPLSQNGMSGDMPGTIIHEMFHALGLVASYDYDDDGTFFFESPVNRYTAQLVDVYGTKAAADMTIEMISPDEVGSVADPDVFYIVQDDDDLPFGGVAFTGENVQEVIGADTVIYKHDFDPVGEDGALVEATIFNSVTGGIPVNSLEYTENDDGDLVLAPELSHLELQNGLMSHQSYRNWQTLMEAEMAVLQDLGYEFDRKRFFGTSVYESGNDNVVITQAFGGRENYAWTGEPSTQATAIGVHIYGSLNTVLVDADQRADGDESFGIRVDGASNDVTIASGRLISANGTNGTGIAFTYGSGHTLEIEEGATVEATGENGRALLFDFGSNELGDYNEYRGSWIRTQQADDEGSYIQFLDDPLTTLEGSLVDQVVIAGTVDAGDGEAIYISENSHVGEILITETASITGDIVSKWNALGTQYKMTYGDGSSVYFIQLDVNYEGFEDLFKAQVVYEEGDIPDLTTSIVFSSSTEGSLFSYSGNIEGANGIRLTVDSGTVELNGTMSVLGVNIKEGGELLGAGAYSLTTQNAGGAKVVGTDEEEFIQGALVNSGTLYSTSLTGCPTLSGNYVQTGTGVLVLDVTKEGEVTPLAVSGNSYFSSGSEVSLIPEATYYETGSTIDSTALTAENVVSGAVVGDEGLAIGFDTAMLSGMSATLTFSEADGVLTISRASNAYSSLVTGGWQSQVAAIFDRNAASATSEDAQALYALMDFSGGDGSVVQSAAAAFGGDSFLQTVRSDFGFERTISRVVESGFDSLHEGKDLWVLPFGGRAKESYGESRWRTRSTGVAAGMTFHDGKSDYGFHLAAAHLKKTDDYHGQARSSGLWLGGSWDRRMGEADDWLAQFRGRVGFVHAKNERSVAILSRHSKFSTSGMQYHVTASAKVGPVFRFAESGLVSPYVGLAGSLIYKPSKSESGFGALAVDDTLYRSVRAQAGVKTVSPRIRSAADPSYTWSFGGRAAYERELLSKAGDFKASIVGMSGSFERAVEWEGRDRGILGVNAALTHNENFTARLGLDTEFSKTGNTIFGFVEARWTF